MLIKERDFDKRLISLLHAYPDMFALSCRGTHALKPILLDLSKNKGSDITDKIFRFRFLKKVIFKTRLEVNRVMKKKKVRERAQASTIHMSSNAILGNSASTLDKIFPRSITQSTYEEAGFIGYFIDLIPYNQFDSFTEQVEKRFNQIWLGETIMRGPLVFSRLNYLAEGGFNIDAFFQGNDDHDLFLRIKKKGKLVGFTPIHFSSPTHLGNARQKRKIRSNLWSKLHRFARRKEFLRSALYLEASNIHE